MRILLLVHPILHPEKKGSATEREVFLELKKLGHHVVVRGVQDSGEELIEHLKNDHPDIVFNLLEEFHSEAAFDFHPVAVCEALGIPYTGSNPRGLVLSRAKHIGKAIASAYGIATPQSFVLTGRTIPRHKLAFPLIVKLNREDASRGLSRKNVVSTSMQLRTCVHQLDLKYQSEMIVEEFIEGFDVTVAMLGRRVFSPWRLHLPSGQHISSEVIKSSSKTRFKLKVRAQKAVLSNEQNRLLQRYSKFLFHSLELSGYARFDYRVSNTGEIFFLEANANPNLSKSEDFARSAKSAGLGYSEVLSEILRLARSYKPRL